MPDTLSSGRNRIVRLPPDFAEMVAHLARLRVIYPEATRGALRRMGRTVWILEKSGATHFGGIEVLAWYLVKRALTLRPSWLQLLTYLEQLKAERLLEVDR